MTGAQSRPPAVSSSLARSWQIPPRISITIYTLCQDYGALQLTIKKGHCQTLLPQEASAVQTTNKPSIEPPPRGKVCFLGTVLWAASANNPILAKDPWDSEARTVRGHPSCCIPLPPELLRASGRASCRRCVGLSGSCTRLGLYWQRLRQRSVAPCTEQARQSSLPDAEALAVSCCTIALSCRGQDGCEGVPGTGM